MNISKIPLDTKKCRECAECCKDWTFYMEGGAGELQRWKLLDTDLIKVEKAGVYRDGFPMIRVIIKIPCRMLVKKNGKYKCRIYNSERRPRLCREYPYEIGELEKRRCIAIVPPKK